MNAVEMSSDDIKKIAINALEDLKAKDIVTLDVGELTDVMDCMIICSGTSSRHVKSLANNVAVDAKKQGARPLGIEGQEEADWVLVDFGDVVVHVMLPEAREFYDLERLWSPAL
jgi:ribosome-associated protein